MNLSESHQGPTPPPPFLKRLFRRVMYMAVAGCVSGAVLGRAVNGPAGAAVWAVAGAVIGVLLGVLVGGYAWVLESPLKGAIRGGGLFAATMGLLVLILLLSQQGWGGLGNALTVALMAAGMGALIGSLLGAFLAWVAGPVFRDIVRAADRGESPTKRPPWW